MALKKGLGLLDVFSIATGAMISSGIFILPGLAFAKTGPSVIVSYFIAGLFALTGLFSIAELSSAMPKAGGDYYFITRSMGPMIGTISGLLSWFSLSLKSSFALLGMAELLHLFYPVNIHFAAAVFTLIFLVLNIFGVEKAGHTQTGLVGVLIIVISIFVFLGIPKIQISNFEPFTYSGNLKIFSTAGFVFISYGGLLKIASVAEEIKNPGKNIIKGMLISIILVVVMYSLMLLVVVGVLSNTELSGSLTPIANAAQKFMGKTGMYMMQLAAITAFISTANAGLLAASRYPLALSRDKLLPEFLDKVSEKYKSPYSSLLVTAGFMIITLFLNLDVLIKVASTVLIMTYILSNFSVIILRESKLQNYRPIFKSPLYPWVQFIGIIGFVFLLIEMGLLAISISLGLIVFGLFVYLSYGRKSQIKEYAFLHLIGRMLNKRLTTNKLQTELKNVILERDEVVLDFFDKLVKESIVLDLQEEITFNEVLAIFSDKISDKYQINKDDISHAFLERENQGSTVITDGVAVPHIIINGKNKFGLLLARSKNGVTNNNKSKIYAFFVLFGTLDDRIYHLRSLASIAQICQNEKFLKLWKDAGTINDLKDLISILPRKRSNF
jgi:amino acid transporter/mannitol/fructose-specific phosphotransferase system IIA component (Ntr-type)